METDMKRSGTFAGNTVENGGRKWFDPVPQLLLQSIVAGCLVLLLGCGQSQRLALTGVVTLDGQPLNEGSITFMPQSGTTSPSAGANVTQGHFSVSAEKGVLPGKFRVEITAKRKTGRTVMSDTAGGMIDQYEQYLPARYNRDSQLMATVPQSGAGLEFALTSN